MICWIYISHFLKKKDKIDRMLRFSSTGAGINRKTCCCFCWSRISFACSRVERCSHFSQNINDEQWIQSNRIPWTSLWQASHLNKNILTLNIKLIALYLLNVLVYHQFLFCQRLYLSFNLLWTSVGNGYVTRSFWPVERSTTSGLLITTMIVLTTYHRVTSTKMFYNSVTMWADTTMFNFIIFISK